MLYSEIRFANGRKYILQEHTSIGRDNTNDICLEDASISSKHAILTIKQGRVFLIELGSTNGSFINGEKVQIQEEVRHDDQITFGMVKARFYMPYDKNQRTQRQQPATILTQKKSSGCLGWFTGILVFIFAAFGGSIVVFDDEIANELQRIETQGLSPDARIQQAALASVKVVACLESKCRNIQQGSGVITKLEGQIRVLTAYHVIENAEKIEIQYNKDDPYTDPETGFFAERISEDTNMDLALLRFCKIGACPSVESIPLGDSDAFDSNSDTKIELFGFPRGKSNALSRYTQAFVGYEADSQISRAFIRTDKKVFAGNSGGAAINSAGELIGLVTENRVGQNTGLLRPSNLIKIFLWK